MSFLAFPRPALRGIVRNRRRTFSSVLGIVLATTMLAGVNIVNYAESELVNYRREWVRFVFQFFNLVPTLNARENVELPMRLAGKTHEDRKSRTEELLDLVCLQDRAIHKPDELSGGEQQRIAIAVALANDPPIILADEPTGELDTKTGQEMLDLFRDLSERLNKTSLMVTHDIRASDFADRTLEIVDGEIVGEA